MNPLRTLASDLEHAWGDRMVPTFSDKLEAAS